MGTLSQVDKIGAAIGSRVSSEQLRQRCEWRVCTRLRKVVTDRDDKRVEEAVLMPIAVRAMPQISDRVRDHAKYRMFDILELPGSAR